MRIGKSLIFLRKVERGGGAHGRTQVAHCVSYIVVCALGLTLSLSHMPVFVGSV